MYDDAYFYEEGVLDALDDLRHGDYKIELLNKNSHNDPYIRGYHDAILGKLSQEYEV